MVLYFCVLIVFSLRRESLKPILVDEPLPEVVLSHSAQSENRHLQQENHAYVGDRHHDERVG
jgi:hypothetical protein